MLLNRPNTSITNSSADTIDISTTQYHPLSGNEDKSSSTSVELLSRNTITLSAQSSAEKSSAAPITNADNKSTDEKKDATAAAPLTTLTLKSLIQEGIPSTDPEDQTQKIVEKFNTINKVKIIPGEGNSAIVYTEAPLRGQRIDRNEMIIAHRNQRPELVPYKDGKKIADAFTTFTTESTKIIKVVKAGDNFFGANGSHVINVKNGQLAKVILGGEYKLLGAGAHIIHETTNCKLTFNPATDFVNLADPYIKHGDIKILRIPKGFIAKIWEGEGNVPKLLDAGLHVIRDWNTRIEPFGYINNNANDPILFTPTTTPLIEHGSITRLYPSTGKAFIVLNKGKMELVTPDDKLPIKQDSETYKFAFELESNTLTLNFPSNKDSKNDEDRYEEFLSKDSLKICAVLMLVVTIEKPLEAAKKLGNQEKIIRHIKNRAIARMGQVMQLCNAQDFLSSAKIDKRDTLNSIQEQDAKTANFEFSISNETKQTRPPATAPVPSTAIAASAASAPPQEWATPLDIANLVLDAELRKFGIHVERLNIEHSKLKDEAIRNQMAQQAIETSKRNNNVSLLVQDKQIKETEAKIDATKKGIEVDNQNMREKTLNDAKIQREIAAANGRLEVQKIENEILKSKAETQRQIETLRGELLTKYPVLFELERLGKAMKPFEDAKMTMVMVPDEMKKLFLMDNAMTLFAPKTGVIAANAAAVNVSAPTQQTVTPTLTISNSDQKH